MLPHALLALASMATVAPATLEIGDFSTPWEAGYSRTEERELIRFVGPGPTGVTVDLTIGTFAEPAGKARARRAPGRRPSVAEPARS